MTHRIVVDLQTGPVTQVEYTAEEQAAYDAAVAAAIFIVVDSRLIAAAAYHQESETRKCPKQ